MLSPCRGVSMSPKTAAAVGVLLSLCLSGSALAETFKYVVMANGEKVGWGLNATTAIKLGMATPRLGVVYGRVRARLVADAPHEHHVVRRVLVELRRALGRVRRARRQGQKSARAQQRPLGDFRHPASPDQA